MSLALSLSGVVGCALALLLAADARGRGAIGLAWKAIASAAFVGVAVALGGFGRDAYSRWVLAGLVLAAGGDVALGVPGKRAFLVGLVLFLFGHVAYVAASATLVPPAGWLGPLALAPVVASAVALAWLWPSLGSMRVPVLAYVAAITLMVVGALSVLARGAASPRAARLAVGAVLFYASDLAVARNRFVAPGFVNRAWGLPAYYAGQLLLAWSIAA